MGQGPGGGWTIRLDPTDQLALSVKLPLQIELDDGFHGITFPVLKDELVGLQQSYLLRDPLSHDNLD